MAKSTKNLKVVKDTEVKKITQEELNKILEFQNALGNLNSKIAGIEITKMDLLGEFNAVRKMFADYSTELEKKYGSVDINLATGEIVEPEATKEQ